MRSAAGICAVALAFHASPVGSFSPPPSALSGRGLQQACRAYSTTSSKSVSFSSLQRPWARSSWSSRDEPGWARRGGRAMQMTSSTDIESPFAKPGVAGNEMESDKDALLPLTLENVETVLDEMRPYLMSDGGNVRVVEIDGPVVRLELEGACGSCPSSTMTMKMGLERRLVQRIPEISEVIQSIPNGPDLNEEEIEKVLDGVRPFLSVAGGSIRIESLRGINSIQPVLMLRMTGESASLQSVRMEIMQRIQRNFMMSTLRVEFTD